MKLYKLTDQNSQTQNETQWGENVTHETSGEGKLCTKGWLHAYEDPLLAVLHNPSHAKLKDPLLWEARGSGKILRDGQMKIGVTRLTTIRQIPLPEVTITQRVAYGILCGKAVYKDKAWNRWADGWLSGKDRSEESADAARDAAAAALYAARDAACAAARYAAEAARYAAPYAAPYAALYAARYTANAARYTADAAPYAARYTADLNLIEIAREAMKY